MCHLCVALNGEPGTWSLEPEDGPSVEGVGSMVYREFCSLHTLHIDMLIELATKATKATRQIDGQKRNFVCVCTPNGTKTKARRSNGKNAERDVLFVGPGFRGG